MYYGRVDYSTENPAISPAQALQQFTDSQVGAALIAALKPNVQVRSVTNESGDAALTYTVEVALQGWWGSASADTLKGAVEAALWDMADYLGTVNTQRFLNKKSRPLAKEFADSWEPREGR